MIGGAEKLHSLRLDSLSCRTLNTSGQEERNAVKQLPDPMPSGERKAPQAKKGAYKNRSYNFHRKT